MVVFVTSVFVFCSSIKKEVLYCFILASKYGYKKNMNKELRKKSQKNLELAEDFEKNSWEASEGKVYLYITLQNKILIFSLLTPWVLTIYDEIISKTWTN